MRRVSSQKFETASRRYLASLRPNRLLKSRRRSDKRPSGTGEEWEGDSTVGEKRSGRPFTIRSVKRALMLRSSSVSVCCACADFIARSCTLRNAFAIVCRDRRRTTAPYFRQDAFSYRFLLCFFRYGLRSDLCKLGRSGKERRTITHLRRFCVIRRIRRLVTISNAHAPCNSHTRKAGHIPCRPKVAHIPIAAGKWELLRR